MKVRMGSYRRKSRKFKKTTVITAAFGLLGVVLLATLFLYMGRTRGVTTTDARPTGDVGDFAYGQMNLELPCPQDIKVTVEKGATIRWQEEDDPQIIGYNVYRYATDIDPGSKVNMSIISDTVYHDDDGTTFNSYAVSAVDTAGKEGPVSEPIAAVAEPSTLDGLRPVAKPEVVEDTTFDETSPQPGLPADIVGCTAEGMNYSGVWYKEHYAEVMGGALMVTPYYGDSASYTFTGEMVTVISTRHWNYGLMDVYIDDDLWQQVDLYSPDVKTQERVFSGIGLGPGTHTIKLVCTGQKNPQAFFTFINLEALEIQ